MNTRITYLVRCNETTMIEMGVDEIASFLADGFKLEIRIVPSK